MYARPSTIFPFSTGNFLFGQICSRKIRIFGLNWSLLPILIRICRIQWWYSLFCFRLETPSLGKFGPKNQIVSLSWILKPRQIYKCRFQWWCSLFFVLYRKHLLRENTDQKLLRIWTLSSHPVTLSGSDPFWCTKVNCLKTF